MTQKAIGPSFLWELTQAGVNGGPYSWTPDGTITYGLNCQTATRAIVEAVYAAHDPTKPDPFAIQQAAQAALDRSDITMHRLAEAVALGLTTWAAADVVAYVTWRRALRAIVASPTSVALVPAQPSYPAGT